jgi:hypothetical protein
MRRYALGVVAASLLTLAVILGFALWLIPLRNNLAFGDLLRLGWYSTNRYSYTLPPIAFVPPLVEPYRLLPDSDVVVLGDSTTNVAAHSWANYLAASGFRVSTLGLPPGGWDVPTLVADPAFRAAPPRLLLLASVERYLYGRLTHGQPPCTAPPASAPTVQAPLPVPGPPRPVHTRPIPPAQRGWIDLDQITYARDFVVNNVRLALGLKDRAVYQYPLDRRRFSSEAGDRLLVLSEDLQKAALGPADIAVMRCRLAEYRALVEANGRTRFALLALPDKLSLYRPDIVGTDPPASLLPALDDGSVPVIRADVALRGAVEAGAIDVFLPSDTHWGETGHRVVADTVLRFLEAD